MRALHCIAHGKPEDLRVVELPDLAAPGPGEVKIEVAAAGLNFADTLMIAGNYQVKPPLPFAPGLECAGKVAAIGLGVTHVKPGDAVMAMLEFGGFASQAMAKAADVFPAPKGMDLAMAASIPIAYGTSYGALVWKAKLKAGEILLVHGAAGGVGLTAVEIGKALGAIVIATAGGADKCAVATAHGADHVIDYKSEDLRVRVKEICAGMGKDGADVVYDPVGGEIFDASLRCVAWNARLIVVGFAAGKVEQIPANILLVKNLDVLGFFFGSYRRYQPDLLAPGFSEIGKMYETGRIKPLVSHRLPLDRAAEGLAMLVARKSTGKVVVTL
jgi:NADPH2:quinone reductase